MSCSDTNFRTRAVGNEHIRWQMKKAYIGSSCWGLFAFSWSPRQHLVSGAMRKQRLWRCIRRSSWQSRSLSLLWSSVPCSLKSEPGLINTINVKDSALSENKPAVFFVKYKLHHQSPWVSSWVGLRLVRDPLLAFFLRSGWLSASWWIAKLVKCMAYSWGQEERVKLRTFFFPYTLINIPLLQAGLNSSSWKSYRCAHK